MMLWLWVPKRGSIVKKKIKKYVSKIEISLVTSELKFAHRKGQDFNGEIAVKEAPSSGVTRGRKDRLE